MKGKLEPSGWRIKRTRGENRQGTRSRSKRIVMRQGMKRKQQRQQTLRLRFERTMKGESQ